MAKANKNQKPPFYGYYQAIGGMCGCSAQYASKVLNDRLGKYSERDNELVQKIRAKAEEMNSILNPK